MRYLILLSILLASFSASAPALAAGSCFVFPRGLVCINDSTAKIIDRAERQPDRIVELQNARGAAVGERWEYYLRGKQVNFTVSGGRVTRVDELN